MRNAIVSGVVALLSGLCAGLVGCCAGVRAVQQVEDAHARQDARCVTMCGLRSDLAPVDCAALNTAEARILFNYAQDVPEFRPGYASCMALDGWTVEVMGHAEFRDLNCPPDAWDDPGMGCVLGMTRPGRKLVQVVDTDFTFNALAHELGHVLDNSYGIDSSAGHCGWDKRGLKKAIRASTGEPDVTKESCAK